MVREVSGPPTNIVLHRPQIHDVTASRAINGTEYQNLSGRPILALLSVLCTQGNANEDAYFYAAASATTPVGAVADRISFTGYDSQVGKGPNSAFFCMTFPVPSNWYYEVGILKDPAAAVTLQYWFEIWL